MDIHEYQAKKILSNFGVTIPRGGIVYSPENAENKAREIGGSRWVVKAQIPVSYTHLTLPTKRIV